MKKTNIILFAIYVGFTSEKSVYLLCMENLALIIGLSVGGAVLLILFVVLYIFVFSKRKYKKQIRELERKYSYLDALLIGQDNQYIHRLEIISRTNLLYVDKHATFQKRFKEILDSDDRYAETVIKQLNALVANNQYKNIKSVINDAKKAVAIFEESVNKLDADLYELIKLEEDSRQVILKLKEKYRLVKQGYYANANDLEMVSESVNQVFDKLDEIFAQYEANIESAEYDEASSLVPTINSALLALQNIFAELPNICSLLQQVIPEKLNALENLYHEVNNLDVPVYHLSVEENIVKWNDQVEQITRNVSRLSIKGAIQTCNVIIQEIEKLDSSLEEEIADKRLFESESDDLYRKVKVLDDSFLKVCAYLPDVYKVYVVEDSQKQRIEELKDNINQLWATKRSLDGFIHSETKQPYSVLHSKLELLKNDYEVANTALHDFKAYLDSLRISCEEAYSMIFIYFYRAKQIENTIAAMALPEHTETYKETLENIFELLNQIDQALKVKPIDVSALNEKAENLKGLANNFFDLVEGESRQCQLAESAIVYANRDRNHQTDVHQQLTSLEVDFHNGEFDKVYVDANTIFKRSHVEESKSGN